MGGAWIEQLKQAQCRLDNRAVRAARKLRRLQAATGNEWAFGFGATLGGSMQTMGPVTSNNPGAVDIIPALQGFSGILYGAIHNHPRQGPTILTPNYLQNNDINRTISGLDMRLDNVLGRAGFNVSSGFTHYVVGSDGVLRAFNEGNGAKPYTDSRVVTRKKCE